MLLRPCCAIPHHITNSPKAASRDCAANAKDTKFAIVPMKKMMSPIHHHLKRLEEVRNIVGQQLVRRLACCSAPCSAPSGPKGLPQLRPVPPFDCEKHHSCTSTLASSGLLQPLLLLLRCLRDAGPLLVRHIHLLPLVEPQLHQALHANRFGDACMGTAQQPPCFDCRAI